MAQKEFPQHYPQPGWVEHDPLDIWSSQISTATEAMAKAGVKSSELVALGIANQRETVVIWERDSGKPIHNAIVWQDRRTAALCQELIEAGNENTVAKKTGLRIDPYFSATKIKWLLDNVAGARDKAIKGQLAFGTIDSWLIWKLTGGTRHVTDVTNASRTMLYNIFTLEWDEELLELLKIPRQILPDVLPTAGNFGTVDSSLPLGGTSISGVAGDQQAALCGQACLQPGMAKNTYGTGCFLLMNTGNTPVPSKNSLLTTVAWQFGQTVEYALEGSIFIAGAVVQWLRDELHLIKDAQEFDRLAASVDDANGLFLVPAFAGLGAPHWDYNARGLLMGITRGSNRAHLCRAALEGIALQVADLLECMQKDSGIDLHELRVDGGGSNSQPLLQIQADLLQTSVIRPRYTETTSLGAAYFAGLGCGLWPDTEEIAKLWQADDTFQPLKQPAEVNSIRQQWNEAVSRCRDWA